MCPGRRSLPKHLVGGVSSQRAEEPRCFSIIPSRSSDQSVLTRTGSSYAPDDWWLIRWLSNSTKN
jgi:hypothetical protein